jgi:hypothetical protein
MCNRVVVDRNYALGGGGILLRLRCSHPSRTGQTNLRFRKGVISHILRFASTTSCQQDTTVSECVNQEVRDSADPFTMAGRVPEIPAGATKEAGCEYRNLNRPCRHT